MTRYTQHQSMCEEEKIWLLSVQYPLLFLQYCLLIRTLQFYAHNLTYKVRHRFYNLILDKDFWSLLFGHKDDSWLDEIRVIRLHLLQRMLNTLTLWFHGRMWIGYKYSFIEIKVCMSIHYYPNHWLLGDLHLESMGVYHSLGRSAYNWLESNGTFIGYEARVTKLLEKINYWRRRNIPGTPLKMIITREDNVPQQNSHLGDCGVFVCMFMEQLVSRQPIRLVTDPIKAAMEFRQRMEKSFGDHVLVLCSCM
uniref:Ubiquitin-like protease family profile domain-containing protein n=1 Tax=Lactuca sativa TaxID=4236 RepID=A0A9R1VI49_LACSA|nr:hypothetical protein LSAT_V11C500265630 [Lactuca sativa]